MSESVRASTWRLPEGHEAVSAWATQEEAEIDARRRIAFAGRGLLYYITDKRGSWEVIA
jgi:hypothetical protein